MYQTAKFKTYGFEKEKLYEMMKEIGLGGILLTSPESVYYTTGYTTLPSAGNPILYTLRNRLPFFFYINSEGETALLCWDFSTVGTEFDVDEVIGFSMDGALAALSKHLNENFSPNAKLGIESTCPYYVLRLIEDIAKPGSIFAVDDILAELRLIKSEDEIKLIKKSTAIIETTLSELYEVIHIGMSRLDLMQETKYRLFKNGATGISHLTYSFGKTNPEFAIDEKIEAGDLITLDLGGIYNGYASDNRRYMFAGSIPDSLVEHYNMMVNIVDTVGDALIPGANYCDIFKRGVDLFVSNNLEPNFVRLGHNIGLETEEQWLDKDSKLAVEENMVINIELYSFAETGQSIGNEETYIIGADGPTRITLLPREIKIIQ